MGTRECPHRTGLRGKRVGDPQLESGKAATETGHNRNSPALGRASLVRKCSGPRERMESWRERKAQVWIDPLGRNGKCLLPSGGGQSSELCLGKGDHVWFQPQSCLRDRSQRSGPCPLRPLWGGVLEAEASRRCRARAH